MLMAIAAAACTSGNAATVLSSPDTPSGSGAPGTTAPPSGTDTTLTVGTPTGIAVVDPASSAIVSSQPIAVPSGDGSRWLTSAFDGTTTRVGSYDPAAGAEQTAVTVDGMWRARVASRDGRAVALAQTSGPPAPQQLAPARSRTELLVVRPADAGVSPQHLELDGNFEPEAFSLDETSLFVLQFTPALAPERYRVRRLDLATGTVEDVPDIDKTPQGDMPGQARTQVRAPDGSALYTLYTVDAGHGHHADTEFAFVHVLDLEHKFAHCIDLPAPFGSAPTEIAALAISPDGSRLFAVDRAAGAVASIDVAHLSVIASAPIAARPTAGTVTATVATGDRLMVATDTALTTIDTRDLHEVATRTMSTPATAVWQSPVSGRLYVAGNGMIAVYDAETKLLHSIDVAALGPVTSIGPGAGPLPSQRESYQCAC